jgi:hypothetical protein
MLTIGYLELHRRLFGRLLCLHLCEHVVLPTITITVAAATCRASWARG